MKNEQWKNENGLKLIQIENVEGNWPAGLISTIGVCCVQNEKKKMKNWITIKTSPEIGPSRCAKNTLYYSVTLCNTL